MNDILTYELIKEYYVKGYYTNAHLRELCNAKAMTQAQYTTLTGDVYWESTN